MDEEYHYDCPLLSKIIGLLAVVTADTRPYKEVTAKLEKAVDLVGEVYKQLCRGGGVDSDG